MTDNTDVLACAWELEGALGLPFRWEGSRLYLEEEALDAWWVRNREAVVAAYKRSNASAGSSSESADQKGSSDA